jgi:hypothetical protein
LFANCLGSVTYGSEEDGDVGYLYNQTVPPCLWLIPWGGDFFTELIHKQQVANEEALAPEFHLFLARAMR